MKRSGWIFIIILILIIIIYIYYNNFYIKSASVFCENTATVRDNSYKNNNLKEPLKLKILTYNIQHGVGIDGELNLDRIVKVIKNSDADVVGLNEVDIRMKRSRFQNQIKYIANKLGMNFAFGTSFRTLAGGYGNAILSKYPITNASNYILPTDKPSRNIINKEENRSLLRTEIEVAPGKTFYFLTTHLSLNVNIRENQLKKINSLTLKLDKPYLLMGDFNSDLNFQYDLNLNIKQVIEGIKTYPASNPQKEIDRYFSSTDIKVVDSYAIFSKASDHLPVFIEIELSSF